MDGAAAGDICLRCTNLQRFLNAYRWTAFCCAAAQVPCICNFSALSYCICVNRHATAWRLFRHGAGRRNTERMNLRRKAALFNIEAADFADIGGLPHLPDRCSYQQRNLAVPRSRIIPFGSSTAGQLRSRRIMAWLYVSRAGFDQHNGDNVAKASRKISADVGVQRDGIQQRVCQPPTGKITPRC